MPHMKPMYWLYLLILTLIMILISIINTYFTKIYFLNNSPSLNSSKKFFWPWKW